MHPNCTKKSISQWIGDSIKYKPHAKLYIGMKYSLSYQNPIGANWCPLIPQLNNHLPSNEDQMIFHLGGSR